MTATATTLSSPSTIQGRPVVWSRLALMLGGAVLGVTATLVISDGDDAPARSATTSAQFQDASAAQAERYVDGLEARAVSASAADVHPSADAAEQWAVSVSAADVHPSADAAEQWASVEASDSVDPGTCTLITREPC